jgi:regulator of Ty1 transposition protein 103
MSYSDDAVRGKLDYLEPTQDSIVTVAQWIMFHRRHADRTAALWLARLQDTPSSAKRLNLIYLANEVVQQSRARSKQDFLLAFEPLIADATSLAYKGASQGMQGKIRRVVEVWRQRSIFDPRIQEQLEKRCDEIDKSKSTGKSLGGGARLGGSLFGGGGVAPELEALNKSQVATSKAESLAKAPVANANNEYAKMTDPTTPVPSAPVRAAKLRGLVKELMAAQEAVHASLQARKELVSGLERLMESNRAKVAEEEASATEISNRIETMEATIRDVEDSIMRGQDVPSYENGDTNGEEDWNQRPETEGFTPPPPDVESFTPPQQLDPSNDIKQAEQMYTTTTTNADVIEEQPTNFNEPPPQQSYIQNQDTIAADQAQKSLLETLNALSSNHGIRSASTEVPAMSTAGSPGDPRMKRRKISHKPAEDEDDFLNAGVGGVDEEGISAMLGQS